MRDRVIAKVCAGESGELIVRSLNGSARFEYLEDRRSFADFCCEGKRWQR